MNRFDRILFWLNAINVVAYAALAITDWLTGSKVTAVLWMAVSSLFLGLLIAAPRSGGN